MLERRVAQLLRQPFAALIGRHVRGADVDNAVRRMRVLEVRAARLEHLTLGHMGHGHGGAGPSRGRAHGSPHEHGESLRAHSAIFWRVGYEVLATYRDSTTDSAKI